MTLLDVNERVDAVSIYPDRVQIALHYEISTSAIHTTSYLREQCGFRRVPRRASVHGRYECPTLGAPIRLEVSQGRSGALWLKASFNPLCIIHDERDDYDGERGVACARNWLHPSAIESDNSWVWMRAHEMVNAIRDDLDLLIARIAGAAFRGRYGFVSMHINLIEAVIDIAADDPGALVHRLGATVRSQYRQHVERGYRQSAVGYQRLDGDVLMIEGYAREGMRFKVYPKTNRRVRLECQLSASGLRSLGLPRSLHEYEDEGFLAFFARLADIVLPEFREILATESHVPADQASPLELMAELGRAVRDAATLHEVLSALVRNGRITRDLGRRGLAAHLMRAGIVDRVSGQRQGLYRPSRRFRSAIEVLSEVDGAWLDFTPEGRAQ